MPADYDGPNMTFVVAGYDDGEPYGRGYLVEVPRVPAQTLQGEGDEFGITWRGQREFVDRLLRGFDPRLPDTVADALQLTDEQKEQMAASLEPLSMQVPLQAMALQDCIDLAIFFVRTTIAAQTLSVGIRGCGGFVHVATITRREGLRFIQRETLRGEPGLESTERTEASV